MIHLITQDAEHAHKSTVPFRLQAGSTQQTQGDQHTNSAVRLKAELLDDIISCCCCILSCLNTSA